MKKEEKVVLEICGLLRNQLRAEIVLHLKREGKPLSYAEIESYCRKIDEKLNTGWLFQNLKLLTEKGLIVNEKELQTQTPTGKVRTSFYKLTERGKIAADFLTKLLEDVKKAIKDGLIDPCFLLEMQRDLSNSLLLLVAEQPFVSFLLLNTNRFLYRYT
ncbi:MAG: hypothetical protein ACUVQ9_12550 [Thermodesulfobacteriota bacterium]